MRKTIFAAMLLAGATMMTATAQEKDRTPQPYNFVTLQGGGQVTFTNNAFDKLATSIGAFSVGRFWTPAVGTRLSVQGYNNKAGYKISGADHTFDFKYVTSDLDVMFNLSNIFAPSKVHPVNVYLLGGMGLSYAWDNDGQKDLLKKGGITESMAWNDDRLVHNFRMGLQLEANIARHWGINLEVAANNLHDRFNSKTNGNGDWQLTGMLGVTFKFGLPKAQSAPKEPVHEPVGLPEEQEEKPVVDNTPAPLPAPVVTQEKIKRVEVFFDINSATIKASEERKVSELAAWMKRRPQAKVSLTAYADAGTGTPEINRAISEKRVKAVAKLLKERHGIDVARIQTDFKGDTVQPFTNNDMNRVTIGVAEVE